MGRNRIYTFSYFFSSINTFSKYIQMERVSNIPLLRITYTLLRKTILSPFPPFYDV